jgi:hypothetical protein
LTNNYSRKECDAIEQLDKLYKSLGLESDETLIDRANARDYKLYGRLTATEPPVIDTTYNSKPTSSLKHSIYARKSAIPDSTMDDMAKRRYDEYDYEQNDLLIVPSPTCADYLRNRTRNESERQSHVNNKKSEIGQILYDDMAYRQLRKDKTPVNRSTSTNSIDNEISSNTTVKMIKQKDATNKYFKRDSYPQHQPMFNDYDSQLMYSNK